MSVAINIENAVKQFGNNTIIHGLNLHVREGEFFTLLGPSGCGKTTLLRMIAGFNSIEGGTFSFNDKVINNIDPAKRNIGMVFQNYAIFPHLTVEENVAYGLKARGVYKGNEALVDYYIKLMGLEGFEDSYPYQISGGMASRAGLARTFFQEPGLILLDEPLSALDAFTRMVIQDEIIKMHEHFTRTISST